MQEAFQNACEIIGNNRDTNTGIGTLQEKTLHATLKYYFEPDNTYHEIRHHGFVAVANYSQSSYELGYALKFLRVILLILTGFFDLWGFGIGLILVFVSICFNKTISGQSYLYPLIPFNGRQLLRRVLRISLPATHRDNEQTH